MFRCPKFLQFSFNPFSETKTTLIIPVIEFKLRIVPFGKDSEWICFEYVNRNGNWKTIKSCSKPLRWFEQNCQMETLIYKLGSGNFDFEKEKFNSLEKILAYEAEQKKLVDDTNTDWERQRNKINNDRKIALDKANKGL